MAPPLPTAPTTLQCRAEASTRNSEAAAPKHTHPISGSASPKAHPSQCEHPIHPAARHGRPCEFPPPGRLTRWLQTAGQWRGGGAWLVCGRGWPVAARLSGASGLGTDLQLQGPDLGLWWVGCCYLGVWFWLIAFCRADLGNIEVRSIVSVLILILMVKRSGTIIKSDFSWNGRVPFRGRNARKYDS